MKLRPATPADVPALAALGRESFIAAFGHLYRAQDLAAFLEETHDEAVVASEVAGGECRHLLAVAENGAENGAGDGAGDGAAKGVLIGYCKLRYPSKLAGIAVAKNPLELSQLYCAGSATGQGVGAALLEWALAQGRAGGHDAMVLSVYSDNHGAQRFYARHGFAKTADTTFKVGEQYDQEYLFEKPFNGARA